MSIEPALPSPAYQHRLEFGCEDCRHLDDYGAGGMPAIDSILVPVEKHLGRAMLAWTHPFRACRKCEAIWAVSYNPKDMIHDLNTTPVGMARALLPEASLDALMVPLFAWAPIDEMTEHALWNIRYEPQALWDRLIAAWRHPEIDTARQADILRQLARLLTLHNPHHRRRQQELGWLLDDGRDFRQDLHQLKAELSKPDSRWFPIEQQVSAHMETLDRLLAQRGTVRPRAPPAPKVDLAVEPTPEIPLPQTLYRSDKASAKARTKRVEPSVPARTKSLLTPYWSFLPALAAAWLIERIISQSPAANQLAGSCLFAFVLVLNGAAVMSNAKIGHTSLGGLVWNRLSAIGDYLLFLVLIVVTIVIANGAVSMAGWDPGSAPLALQLGVGIGCLTAWLIRLWPFWIIPYMQPVELDIPDAHMYGNVKRPAMRTAWQITGRPGTFKNLTLPWMFALVVGMTLTALAVEWAGSWGRIFLLYPVILPVLTALTWALVERSRPSD